MDKVKITPEEEAEQKAYISNLQAQRKIFVDYHSEMLKVREKELQEEIMRIEAEEAGLFSL